MQYWRNLSVLVSALFLSCTNYSVTKTHSTPPILVSISAIPTGYQIVMRTTNQEPFLLGYKLYVGATVNDARNPADLSTGLDCSGGIKLFPNQPIEYSAEVSSNTGGLAAPNAGENGNRICKFQTSLTSGKYVAMRTILISIQPSNQGGNSFNYSLPSNALVVP